MELEWAWSAEASPLVPDASAQSFLGGYGEYGFRVELGMASERCREGVRSASHGLKSPPCVGHTSIVRQGAGGKLLDWFLLGLVALRWYVLALLCVVVLLSWAHRF